MIYPWGDNRPFNSYSGHFKKIFGKRIQKLTVNAGFTCPNRDGTAGYGGCSFCNNEAFTPSYCNPAKSIRQQIAEGIDFHRNRYRCADKYLVYFQSFSNTYAPLDTLREVYSQALDNPDVIGMVIGTRPDCIDDEKLNYLASLAENYYVAVEYGIESCYDQTLLRINRGHDFECARRAVTATAKRNIPVGAHFILGLPDESDQMLIDQTEIINSLPLTTVKFHQLQIFKNTAMADDWAAHPEQYHFRSPEEYIDLFIEILMRLRPDMVVERFAGEAPPRFHYGPAWGTIRNEQLLAMLEKRLTQRGCYQSMLWSDAQQ